MVSKYTRNPWLCPHWETTKAWQDLIFKLKIDTETSNDPQLRKRLEGFFDTTLHCQDIIRDSLINPKYK